MLDCYLSLVGWFLRTFELWCSGLRSSLMFLVISCKTNSGSKLPSLHPWLPGAQLLGILNFILPFLLSFWWEKFLETRNVPMYVVFGGLAIVEKLTSELSKPQVSRSESTRINCIIRKIKKRQQISISELLMHIFMWSLITMRNWIISIIYLAFSCCLIYFSSPNTVLAKGYFP